MEYQTDFSRGSLVVLPRFDLPLLKHVYLFEPPDRGIRRVHRLKTQCRFNQAL